MTSMLTIDCSSSVLKTVPPDSYSRTEDLCTLEEQENEQYQAYLDELLPDERQPSLLGGVVTLKRRDFPPGHPNHYPDGYYELSGKKFLSDYLGKCWFDTFEELLESKRKQTGIRIKLVRKGMWSPKEYNFHTDTCEFDLKITEKNLKKIDRDVLKYKKVFDEYLYENYSSYPGFWSFRPNHITGWQEQYDKGVDTEHGEAAVWQLLGFWLFAFDSKGKPSLKTYDENQENFTAAYERSLEDAYGNGVVSDCFEFIEGDYETLCGERS